MLAQEKLATTTLSLTGKRWEVRSAEDRLVLAIQQQCEVPELVARIMAARGVALEDAPEFLNPSLKHSLPDPLHLLDMDKASARVAAAIMKSEKIAIWGDYDVDGATSSALLMRYFRLLGADPLVYIPDRMTEGYGPNRAGLLQLKAHGARVIITVDCGTLSFEPLRAAAEAGLDVIVIDHHQGEARKPDCTALVNPNRLDETSEHRHLAAVGVAFLLAVAINKKLREAGMFLAKKEPNLMSLLDLVALGTVCDVVPLTGVNRTFVAQGLKVMAARGNLGMATLMDMAKIDEKPSAYHLGYVLGPRINAGGRVGKANLGTRLLTTEDSAEALSLAHELELHNNERKAIEANIQEQADRMAELMPAEAPLLVVAGKGWHQGVIGIVAGRLKERFNKPVAVIALNDGVGKASARSVPGFDFGAAVIAACEAGLLVTGGGHAMAAGFTVAEDKLEAFTQFLTQRAQAVAAAFLGPKLLRIDAHSSVSGLTVELVEMLEKIGPFGSANPAIKLAVHNAVIVKIDPVGKDHMRLIVKDNIGSGALTVMAFRAMGTPLGDGLMKALGRPVEIVVQPSLREWMGKKNVSLQLEDIKIS